MWRLPQQLLSLCLTGALLLRLSQGNDAEYEYEYDYDDYNTTAMPDFDYNVTFDYVYYSNTSGVDYDIYEILKSRNDGTQIENKKENKAPETDLPSLLLVMSLSLHQLYQLQ